MSTNVKLTTGDKKTLLAAEAILVEKFGTPLPTSIRKHVATQPRWSPTSLEIKSFIENVNRYGKVVASIGSGKLSTMTVTGYLNRSKNMRKLNRSRSFNKKA